MRIDIASSFTTEEIQDIIGGMVSGNSESRIGVTYDDNTGKLNFNVNRPVQSVEQIQDIVGNMVSGNVETGITVTYDDSTGKLNFDTPRIQRFNVNVSDTRIFDAQYVVASYVLTLDTFNIRIDWDINFTVRPIRPGPPIGGQWLIDLSFHHNAGIGYLVGTRSIIQDYFTISGSTPIRFTGTHFVGPNSGPRVDPGFNRLIVFTRGHTRLASTVTITGTITVTYS